MVGADGLFTAGDEPGSYDGTVQATARQGAITKSATADVTVEPDRIVFRSDRDEDQPDLYPMDLDGKILERLTNTAATEFCSSWSPDGRRIVHDVFSSNRGIDIINDDGAWQVSVIDNDADFVYFEASWSPDGSRIAMVKISNLFESDEARDIYVMDVDGGNLIQLTDTANGYEYVPTWSPDGSKIVYDFTPTGANGEIWVMDADGSNKKRLTLGFCQ